jgi:hypothetical protein
LVKSHYSTDRLDNINAIFDRMKARSMGATRRGHARTASTWAGFRWQALDGVAILLGVHRPSNSAEPTAPTRVAVSQPPLPQCLTHSHGL